MHKKILMDFLTEPAESRLYCVGEESAECTDRSLNNIEVTGGKLWNIFPAVDYDKFV
jgi:hypothetical protein